MGTVGFLLDGPLNGFWLSGWLEGSLLAGQLADACWQLALAAWLAACWLGSAG